MDTDIFISVADEFVRKFSAAVDAMPFGMPWEKGVKLTPLPEAGKTDKMNKYVLYRH